MATRRKRQHQEPHYNRVNVKCRIVAILVGIVLLALQEETSQHRLTLELASTANRTFNDTPSAWKEEEGTVIRANLENNISSDSVSSQNGNQTVSIGSVIVHHCDVEEMNWYPKIPSRWDNQIFEICGPNNSSSLARDNTIIARPRADKCTVFLDYILDHYFSGSFSDITVFLSAEELESKNLVQKINNDMVDHQLPFVYIGTRQNNASDPVTTSVSKEELWQILSESSKGGDSYSHTSTIPPPAASFAVQKAQILANPQSFYRQLRDQILLSEDDSEAMAQWRCNTLERYWHVLFEPPSNQSLLVDPPRFATGTFGRR